ncbi:hypothetical protein AVEN_256143-1 [Araneus ventricosus]|uniref:RNase H type-1 domain-containing protein n=1 Tax=Araneus ventricosus TaxID=182803 RepID=A0A4Y2RBS6_ARAVE|nr:hypothetical protein AVEN_256143-1 [Araneus ventricosus]
MLQSRESDADAEMSSSSASEGDTLEYDMSEDLEDTPENVCPTTPPPPSTARKRDGSKFNNRVGCAMVRFEDGNEKEHEIWRLNNEATVFIAEMVAIREAANYCKRRQIAKANIILDSRSALVSIVFRRK